MRVGAASDVGRSREVNEDSVLTGRTVFAVVDGMGGHAAGEVASALAVARLGLLAERADPTPDDVRASLTAANRDILASGARDSRRRGMGATVAGITIVRMAGTEHWVVFNIGDCRVYRFVDGGLRQLTRDHNEAAEAAEFAVGAGGGDTRMPSPASRRNVVTRSLGTDPAPEADIRVLPPIPGERFLVCSDGLCGELSDTSIADVLDRERSALGAAEALVRAAVAAGSRDDVSAVVVDHGPVGGSADGEDTMPRQVRTGAAS